MRPLILRSRDRVRRDPAPSKWGYRYERLMLTPGVKGALRLGVPLAVVVGTATAWLSDPANLAAARAQVDTVVASFQQRPEFMVTRLEVTGADPSLRLRAAARLPIEFPVSSFALDLTALREAVEELEAVKTASVRVGRDGALDVRITPRVPVALWRDGTILRLIDDAGVPSGVVVARADRPGLPLIAGEGAEEAIREALALYNRTGPLKPRVRGLVRVGDRRWDLVLDRDQRVLLPATNPVAALERVIALDHADDMMARDVALVDMRNPARPVLRIGSDTRSARLDAAGLNGDG